MQRPRDVLTERMQRRVERELADSDLALIVVNGEEGVGAGDRFIARALLGAGAKVPVICAVNKVRSARDRTSWSRCSRRPPSWRASTRSSRSAPAAARGSTPWSSASASWSPRVPILYPPEDRSDQSSEVMLAELIREQVLNRTRDEIPHSVEVSVKEIAAREDGLVTVRAEVWAETESQKGILIGRGGAKVARDRNRRTPLARSGARRQGPPRISRSGFAAAGAATRTSWIAWASSR